MKCQLLIIILSIALQSCNAAPVGSPVPLLDFKPAMVDSKLYKGKIIEGRRWKDKRGENIVILTETGLKWKDVWEATRNASLYAYHFVRNGDSTLKEVWTLNEVVYNCAFETVRCEFFDNSLSITDLDGDSVAEVSFVYAYGCTNGSTEPDDKKLVLTEGKDQYAIKGKTLVIRNQEKLGGNKDVPANFKQAPEAFLEYANKQWDRFGTAKTHK
jgi:hypothetical protein